MERFTLGANLKPPFVRSNCSVELYTVTCIYMNISVVILPRNTELDNSLRDYHSLKKGNLLIHPDVHLQPT